MARDTVIGVVHRSMIRRWLEVVLPLYTLAFLAAMRDPEYTPAFLSEHPSDSLLPWLGWAIVGAMTGILILWAIILGFFLLYSPFYLVRRVPRLLGGHAWVDKR